jgi:hypothetical protein
MDKNLFFYELEGRGYIFQNKKWDEAKHGFEDDMLNMAWEMWSSGQAAKAEAVPEGFVLIEESKVKTWYQDNDEPENFCNSESDLDCLGDCLDDDEIIIVNVHESAHISTRKVFGVWKSNSPTDIQSKFILVDSRVEAEQVVAENKAMIEAQEQKG